jgi:hypothetical protein
VQLHTFSFSYILQTTKLFSNACRFVLFSLVALSENAENVRGAQRELKKSDTVDLGDTGNFAILAKTGITNVPASAITGDIGVSPIGGAAMTGFTFSMHSSGKFQTSEQINGRAYASDYKNPTPKKLTAAVLDMGTAYRDAAGRPNADESRKNLGAGILAGKTLTPGVYTFSTGVHLTGDIYLDAADSDGKDDDDAVFIIQMAGSLKQDADKNVFLSNGAQAKNVFWQIAGNVEVLAGAHMEGILLVKTDVTFVTGSSLNGRVLAQTACALQKATIVEQ